ncbi:MAG: hypothetical protein IH624_10990, partial [Phycisphaerae bacterium]|nr:hypothetical protein [Phycisphaerae bacterium]
MNKTSTYLLTLTCLTITTLLTAVPPAAADDTGEKPQLCQGNYQTEAQAKAQLAQFAAAYSNRQEWQTRAANIRKGIL